MSLTITSTAFTANGAIPSLYTCEGKDVSPPLSWSGAPSGAKSFALIVDDPDAPDPAAPKMTWVQWVLYDIDTVLPDLKRPKKAELEKAMRGHIVAEAVLIGTYQKSR